jgi:hypothetical protein
VACEQGVAEVPLRLHDPAAVALERERGVARTKRLALTQKPSDLELEGFYRERVSPARGGCGRRG